MIKFAAPSQTRLRYGFIDAVRGIAAVIVLLQHSLYQSGLLANVSWHRLSEIIPTRLELGETGVVAFFLVSGFVIPLSLEKAASFKLFWAHRGLRIYPLYVAVFLVTFALRAGWHLSFASIVHIACAHLLFVQEYLGAENFVGGSWTLSLEMVWYISLSGLFLLSLNKRTGLLVASCILLSLVAEVACALGHHFPMGRLSMLVCCVFGFVCYRFDQRDLAVKTFSVYFVALICAIAANLYVGEELFPSKVPTASFDMASDSWALAGLIFFLPFFTRSHKVWLLPPFAFLGRISYSIYLVHPLVLYCEKSTPLNGLSLIMATLLMTTGISILTYHLIELPPIRYGHSLRGA